MIVNVELTNLKSSGRAQAIIKRGCEYIEAMELLNKPATRVHVTPADYSALYKLAKAHADSRDIRMTIKRLPVITPDE
jgi:hypothetical protein